MVDPNGHSGWGWLTSAVSNVASDIASGASAVGSDLTAAGTDISNAWKSLPPSTQADIVTGAVMAASAAAIVLTAGVAAPVVITGDITLSTVITGAGIGASVSSGAYAITSGKNATPGGALDQAVSGAVSGGNKQCDT